MLYMVVEHFKTPGALDIYRRIREEGRLMPGGWDYISSWVDLDYTTCYQLMETDDPTLFEEWIDQWCDLIDFEVVPVQTSVKAALAIGPRL
jgi:hypothetical protein